MRKLKALAVLTTLAASMVFSVGVQADPTTPGPLPEPTYTEEQCYELSRTVDLSYSRYLAILSSGADAQTVAAYLQNYNDVNDLYDQVCVGYNHNF